MTKRYPQVLAAIAVLAIGSCSSKSTDSKPEPTKHSPSPSAIAVTVKDFAIAVASTSTPAGIIQIDVANTGPSTHEFVIFRTGIAADALPVKGDIVDEHGAGVEHVDEIEGIEKSGSKSLSVGLTEGAYVFICNLSGHYKQGMRTPFTVTKPASSAPVGVTLKDFSITLDHSSVAAGPIDFSLTNSGPTIHEFVIFRTDLAPASLPLKDGAVDEKGQGVEHVTEIEGVKTGAKAVTLSAVLPSGSYVFVCNLPSHYKLGMHASFTVT